MPKDVRLKGNIALFAEKMGVAEKRQDLIPPGSLVPHPKEWKGVPRKIDDVWVTSPPKEEKKVDGRSAERKKKSSRNGSQRYSIRHAKQKDPRAWITIVDKNGMVIRRRPTPKQEKFLHYLGQGYSQRQARMKAGYRGIKSVMGKIKAAPMRVTHDAVKTELLKLGIDAEKVAKKIATILDAKDPIISKAGEIVGEKQNYDAQIKAYDRLDKLMQISAPPGPPGSKKRTMTLEEWSFGSEEEQGQ